MKNILTKASLAVCFIGLSFHALAGNKDRTGQAGATELLINPWAQSTGMFGLNTSYVKGVEAMKNNIAGLAFVDKLEVGVSSGIYLTGSQVTIGDLAIATKLGNVGVLGLNIMSMSFGDITVTQYDHPEGFGTYHPQYFNGTLGFAKEFSNSIHAGISATFISEDIGSVSASGACFDAGVQYVTGKKDNFHFGITLRNIGTNMKFSGNGLAIDAQSPQSTPSFAITAEHPTDKFEMPTYLSMGTSYDFYLDAHHTQGGEDTPKHRLTVMADFTSNSFINDYLGAAVEYSFNEMFMLRGGYRYENGIGSTTTSQTIYTGVAVGATVQPHFGQKSKVSFDYSFRPTGRPANGVHMFSIRVKL